jgi:catechol 2,3-dioxygenase-like lactoylglutathione lyase family enzyme
MPVMPTPSVVIFVRDVRAMSEFYRSVASMDVVVEHADHAILEIPGFQLVIHSLWGEPAPQRLPEGPVVVREDSYIKVCLPVGSIATARARAVSGGGSIKPEPQEWEARGFRACDGHDPEGNVFQVRENAG